MIYDAQEVRSNLKTQTLAAACVERQPDQDASHRVRVATRALLSVSSDYFLANLDSLHAQMFSRRAQH